MGGLVTEFESGEEDSDPVFIEMCKCEADGQFGHRQRQMEQFKHLNAPSQCSDVNI